MTTIPPSPAAQRITQLASDLYDVPLQFAADAIRAVADQVAPEKVPAGFCNPELQRFVEVINCTFRAKLFAVAAELEGGGGHFSGGIVKQKVITPPTVDCVRCDMPPSVSDLRLRYHHLSDKQAAAWGDFGFRDAWQVRCLNCGCSTKFCGTKHRAICRWNNAQARIAAQDGRSG